MPLVTLAPAYTPRVALLLNVNAPNVVARPAPPVARSSTMLPPPAAIVLAYELTAESVANCNVPPLKVIVWPTPPAALSWVVPSAPPTAMSTSALSTPPCTGAPAEFRRGSRTGTRRRTQPSPASSTCTSR